VEGHIYAAVLGTEPDRTQSYLHQCDEADVVYEESKTAPDIALCHVSLANNNIMARHSSARAQKNNAVFLH